jgi:hypothetical protein
MPRNKKLSSEPSSKTSKPHNQGHKLKHSGSDSKAEWALRNKKKHSHAWDETKRSRGIANAKHERKRNQSRKDAQPNNNGNAPNTEVDNTK